MRRYPIDVIQHAIRMHRERCPFWPALSDLMPFLSSKIEFRLKEAERLRVEQRQIERHEDHLRQEDPEVRKAAVAPWKEGIRDELVGLAEEDKEEHRQRRLQRMKIKNWRDPEVLKASAIRLGIYHPQQGEASQ